MSKPHFLILCLFGLALGNGCRGIHPPKTPPGDFEQTIRHFSANRHALSRELSTRLELPLPPEADAFFHAATHGDWPAVSNAFKQVKQHGGYGPVSEALRNELWAPIHETFGVWEVWAAWRKDHALLTLLYEPILASMPRGSIYFGGTDYGRFVMTAANAVRRPPPVFCLTQNALADNTYAAFLRALHGDALWLPKSDDMARAFQRYVDEVRSGARPKHSQIEIIDGRVQVSGVLGVMQLNGILAEMIFNENRDTHPLFVEESYVLEWMVPYLEPHGLIMKLNPEPLAVLPDDVIERDMAFWRDHEARLFAHPDFAANREARKAFSKLRSGIAGLYVHRERFAEAEAAFRQALRICPTSPEAAFRLARMLEQTKRLPEAAAVMEAYLVEAPPDAAPAARQYLRRLRGPIAR